MSAELVVADFVVCVLALSCEVGVAQRSGWCELFWFLEAG